MPAFIRRLYQFITVHSTARCKLKTNISANAKGNNNAELVQMSRSGLLHMPAFI